MMTRETCQLGLTVTFGRTNGAVATGVVIKRNPAKAHVQLTEQWNSHPVGRTIVVPYAMLHCDEIDDCVPPVETPTTYPQSDKPLALSGKALGFFRTFTPYVVGHFERWLDEQEYEDIAEYRVSLQSIAQQYGVEIVSMTRKPFGCTLTVDGSPYKMECRARGGKLTCDVVSV